MLQVPIIYTAYYKWILIDPRLPNTKIPCFYKPYDINFKEFIPTKIVSKLILSQFDEAHLKESLLWSKIYAVNCTKGEIDFLNEANFNLKGLFGTKLFTHLDTLISLEQFLNIYDVLVKTVPLKKITEQNIKNYAESDSNSYMDESESSETLNSTENDNEDVICLKV
ncbi:unnamed protein product [Brachionus calyciflorus]|uniref:Uncharacterized protein n=1 Tax=Brachionus calyciflorus TaxID=104777 RepID=A0A814FZ38_9BILA|nr:unnamed protein product [Brachionus calyciflorus]